MATSKVYQIRVQGHLGAEWSAWFDGLVITNELGGETVMTGPVTDQAALHGLLAKIRDLGIPLLSVARPDSARETVPAKLAEG